MTQAAKLAVYVLVFKDPDPAAMLRINSELDFLMASEVLCVHRQATGYRDNTYSLVAGRVEDGEAPLAAAVREIREESGLEYLPEQLHCIGCMYRLPEEGSLDAWLDIFFHAPATDIEPVNAEPAIHGHVLYIPVGKLLSGQADYPLMPHQLKMFQAITTPSGPPYVEYDPKLEPKSPPEENLDASLGART